MKRLRPILAVAALAAFSIPARSEITQEEYRQMQTRFQQAEEDVDRLRGRVQKLEATIAELRSGLGDVRSTAASAGKDAVTQEQLKKVVEQLREIDKRRQEDNDKIVLQLKKLADIPAPTFPTESEKTEKKAGGGKTQKHKEPAAQKSESAGASTNAPAAEAKPLLPANYEFFEHTVGENQTLGEILAEYNKTHGMKVRLKHVLEANPKLNPNRMVVGKKIRIPVVK